ncbi:hypothetical protein BU14_0572s0001 [Porphyra umbilicalis]|uniref:Uncharacterized protein n=1 Tax=Porphyra umbilicalis TaxID=2786 RepID=A0A1X6NRP4_PORUM|nr:hypothetical protein BU14_0572s0001 [Porphyra umbilicalis]|eukprot:OSX71252.1 hypothetical protein BU14_0572s0001 [Porphyra umbilicalis]
MDPSGAPAAVKRPAPPAVDRPARCVRAKGADRPAPGGGGPPAVAAAAVDPTAASAGSPPGAGAADGGGSGAADAALAAGGAPTAGRALVGALWPRRRPAPTAYPFRVVGGAPLWSAVRVGAAKAYADTPPVRLEAVSPVGVRVFRVVPPAAAAVAALASGAGGGKPVAPTREPYDLWYLPPAAVERAAAVHKVRTPAGWYVAAAVGDEVEVDLVGTAADGSNRVVEAAVASLAAARHRRRPQLRGSVLVDGGSLGYTQALANLDGGGLPPTAVPFCGYGRWEDGALVYTARIRLGKTVDAHATTAGVAGGGAAAAASGGAAAVGTLTAEFFVRAEATERRHGRRRPPHNLPSAGAPPAAVLSEAPWFGRHGFADAHGAPVGMDRGRHAAVLAAAAAADAARRAAVDAGVRASAARVTAAAAAAAAAAEAADGGVAAGGGDGGTPPRPRPLLVDLTAAEPTG